MIAMVKTNGYGHGLVALRREALKGRMRLGLPCIEEAVILRGWHSEPHCINGENF